MVWESVRWKTFWNPICELLWDYSEGKNICLTELSRNAQITNTTEAFIAFILSQV